MITPVRRSPFRTLCGCVPTTAHGRPFDEQERGSLEAGKIADMAVLSENPYTVPKDKIKDIRVERLYLSGKSYESCRESILPMMLRGLTSRNKA